MGLHAGLQLGVKAGLQPPWLAELALQRLGCFGCKPVASHSDVWKSGPKEAKRKHGCIHHLDGNEPEGPHVPVVLILRRRRGRCDLSGLWQLPSQGSTVFCKPCLDLDHDFCVRGGPRHSLPSISDKSECFDIREPDCSLMSDECERAEDANESQMALGHQHQPEFCILGRGNPQNSSAQSTKVQWV